MITNFYIRSDSTKNRKSMSCTQLFTSFFPSTYVYLSTMASTCARHTYDVCASQGPCTSAFMMLLQHGLQPFIRPLPAFTLSPPGPVDESPSFSTIRLIFDVLLVTVASPDLGITGSGTPVGALRPPSLSPCKPKSSKWR